ncbi:MAG TPA: hypothetical protein VN376_08620 [Longilinea sp.]|nr:hypothetical protein [Longilinea sp.]
MTRPASTATPQATPTLHYSGGETVVVQDAGFSLEMQADYSMEYLTSSIMVRKEGISFYFFSTVEEGLPEIVPEELISTYLDRSSPSGISQIEMSGPYPIVVDGSTGVYYNLSGPGFGTVFEGQALVVDRNPYQFMLAIALVSVENDPDLWNSTGLASFQEYLGSINFLYDTECVVSTDPTYGYSQDNPIRVGGDAFDGPFREDAYLTALRGHNGQVISSSRYSLPYGDTILDVFTITFPGAPGQLIIYIDEYSYAEPQAPVGFTCGSTFFFTEPED